MKTKRLWKGRLLFAVYRENQQLFYFSDAVSQDEAYHYGFTRRTEIRLGYCPEGYTQQIALLGHMQRILYKEATILSAPWIFHCRSTFPYIHAAEYSDPSQLLLEMLSSEP